MVGADYETALDGLDDPRLSGRYVRLVGDDVVLVGVVHDHPASIFRSRAVVDAVDPATVALEIPNGLMPLFRQYAADDSEAGGEMVAAIDAADEEVVGIDLPDRGSLRTLAGRLRRADISLGGKARAVATAARLYAHTLRGRLVAAGVPSEWLGRDPGATRSYDCSDTDAPTRQAEHESVHISRSRSLSRAFVPPETTRVLDAAREAAMVERLEELRKEGRVVAVLGYDHVDAVADELAGETRSP